MKPDRKRKAVKAAVQREAGEAKRLAGRIWKLAEPPLQEEESSHLLADYLASRGFKVDWPISCMPTAFRATYGRGRPVIGFLGEYDALPDCGLKKGTYGHACGHNLLGVGSAAGAVATAHLMEEGDVSGRLEYWGCPAEEALAGKVYMARDGAFRGLDACLTWHPGNETRAKAAGGSALDSLVFDFQGRTAHGASAEGGRSALDAAVLMDVAVNYLREHVPDNVRIHCVIRDGGNAPNVVPEHARIWYFVRAKDRAQVDEIGKRVILCAKGAATATETEFKVKKLTAVYSKLRNEAMAELVRDNLVLMGAPRATAKDCERVKELGKEPDFGRSVNEEISSQAGKATSDEDNVSWLAPLGCFGVACVPKGIRGHHREYTAQSNLPFAHRGMLYAAQAFAGIAWDLLTDARTLRRIRSEFRKATKGFEYDPLIPKRQRPPISGV